MRSLVVWRLLLLPWNGIASYVGTVDVCVRVSSLRYVVVNEMTGKRKSVVGDGDEEGGAGHSGDDSSGVLPSLRGEMIHEEIVSGNGSVRSGHRLRADCGVKVSGSGAVVHAGSSDHDRSNNG